MIVRLIISLLAICLFTFLGVIAWEMMVVAVPATMVRHDWIQWLFVAALLGFLWLVLPREPVGTHKVWLGMLTAIVVVVFTCIYLTPPSDRTLFLRNLYSVQLGMTEPEVRQIMSRYMEGTRWPAPYAGQPRAPGAPLPELTIPGSVVFRWSPTENDWGIVKFKHGRVVDVDFSAD